MPKNPDIVKLETVLHGGNGGGGLVGRVAEMNDRMIAQDERVRNVELNNARLDTKAAIFAGLVSGVIVAVSGVVVALTIKLLGG